MEFFSQSNFFNKSLFLRQKLLVDVVFPQVSWEQKNSTKKNFDVSATFDQQIHSNIFHTLRIMRSQVTGCLEMFGDPKPLPDTSKPFFFAGLPVILRVDS